MVGKHHQMSGKSIVVKQVVMKKFLLLGLLSALLGFANVSKAQDEDGSYRLKVGDTVQIQVIGEADLTMDVPVNETGVFIYPLLGEVKLLDKTIVDIQSIITEGLRGDYLIDPQVNVNVQFALINEDGTLIELPEGVYINGEVRNSGQYPFQENLTVGKAIVLAGGFTDRAARTKVTVVTNDGDQKPKRVDPEHILKPGDVVNVPRRFF